MFASILFLVFQTLLSSFLISAESHLTATLQPASFQTFAIQEVHLYPGWEYPLKEMTIQTMIPEVGSNFSRCHVRVFPGRQPVEGAEDMHAHVYFPAWVEEITIYIEHDAPEVTELPATPGAVETEIPTTPEVSTEYVSARLHAEKWSPFQDGEIVHLSPPWFSENPIPIHAFLTSKIVTHFPPRKVLIVTGWQDVTKENGGIRAIATVYSKKLPATSTNTWITIYPDGFSLGSTTVTTPEESFLNARIFPKMWHSFRDDQFVRLYPGWKGHLKSNTTQTLVPVDLGAKSELKCHVVVVVPGYQTILDGDLAAEARVTLPDGEGLANPHDEVTIYYP